MSERDDGGPAFPGPIFTPRGFPAGQSMGMTLRDWFAGQALAGMLVASPSLPPSSIAEDCFKQADAMLAARTQEPPA